MPPERVEIGSSVQLLVEGKDAENLFRGAEARRGAGGAGGDAPDGGGVVP